MLIRPAKITDLSQLFNIYKNSTLNRELINDKNYQCRVQKSGFLLGTDTKEELERLLQNSPLFLVCEEEQQILGYLIADNSDQYLDDKYKTWFNDQVKQLYFNSTQIMSINSLAIHPNYKKEGVASKLLQELERKLIEQNIQYLFSIITLAPLANCASLLFHTKHGFKRLAMSSPKKMFELDNYSSLLMYKKIN